MEKQNVVKGGKTPCRVCQGGHTEYTCPKCKLEREKKASELASGLDPERFAEEHK